MREPRVCRLCHLEKPYESFASPPRPGRIARVEPYCAECRAITGRWNSKLKGEGLAVITGPEVTPARRRKRQGTRKPR